MLRIRTASFIAAVLLPPCVAHAQTVTFTNQTPITAQVTVNGQTQSGTLPAGILPAIGDLTVMQSTTAGGVVTTGRLTTGWELYAFPQVVHLEVLHRASTSSTQAGPPVTSAMASSPADYVLSISNPTAMLAELEISLIGHTPTSSTRVVEVDVDNDGSIELSQASYNFLRLPFSIGPQPRTIRIRSEFSATTPVFESDRLSVSITPTANLAATTVANSCATGSSLRLQGTFANEFAAFAIHPRHAPRPTVIVLGFTAQPILLPTTPLLSCILFPAVDVPIFLPTGRVEIAIPPTFRPGVFWSQAVVLEADSLRVTDGYRVTAF